MTGTGAAVAAGSPVVALFDLDGTLTWRDTLVPFLAGYLARRPRRILRAWRIVPALLRYLTDGDRGLLKSAVIRATMGGESRRDVESWADRFVHGLHARGAFRPQALAVLERHRSAGDRLVLLSASPDLYVPRIGALLGFELTLCTGVAWRDDRLDGALTTANRRGEEKVRCLQAIRGRYPGLAVGAYGNGDSDVPHLRLADRPMLVNGNRAARREAVAAGIPCGQWS